MTAVEVPTFADAAARRVVRLPNGTTATLVSVPGRWPHRQGAKARVLLPSGAYLSVPLPDLSLLPLGDR